MWLFPNLNIGVSPKSKAVSDVVNQRLTYNLIAIGMLSFLLIVGFTLLIRNLRREMFLAKAKSDFVANVSHELRTPLALISMFSETLMLGRVQKEEKKKEYIEIIFKETHRLTNMVNQILNFSRIEAGKREYHLEDMELNELVSEVCRDYSYHLEQKGFAHFQHPSEEEAWIKGDREAIYEAMVNLLDNAIKYSKDTKQIDIYVRVERHKCALEIQDKGVGMAPDRIAHIFEKFYRITDKDVYTVQGAGLGLSIIKHIMDAHHAQIDVSSIQGKGTTFKLLFNQQTNG
jgi:two-component system phosphate regulon sensor histidine kinase PhoR